MTNPSYPAVSQERSRGRDNGTAQLSCAPMSWHKWREVLSRLRMAKEALGLNKSRLDLLEKMLACLPGDTISPDANGRLIVFASNARLAEMTHRDNDKTITRLITELEDLRLLERRSSPNGKRYARQGTDGQRVAYGIDLGPLLARMPEIEALAQAAHERLETCRRLREACSIMLKQLAERIGQGDATQHLVDDGRRVLRRKPNISALTLLHRALSQSTDGDIPDGNISTACDMPTPVQETSENGGYAPQNTCHKYTSPISIDKKAPLAKQDRQVAIPLTPAMVEQTMPRVANLGRQIRGSLRDLVERLLRCLGIGQTLWSRSLEKFGFQESALIVMVIYERQRHIRHAPGYFSKIIKNISQDKHAGSKLVSTMLSAG